MSVKQPGEQNECIRVAASDLVSATLPKGCARFALIEGVLVTDFQERRATERQWARRSRQIDAVTFNVSGMYGDLQGLVPSLPPIALLELPEADEEPMLAAQ